MKIEKMPYASNDGGAKTSMAEYAVSCAQPAQKKLYCKRCKVVNINNKCKKLVSLKHGVRAINQT